MSLNPYEVKTNEDILHFVTAISLKMAKVLCPVTTPSNRSRSFLCTAQNKHYTGILMGDGRIMERI